MLKPGGRAAIVLPQGKFNNSSLAFIREWILKKARLLAVVGLHPNTFKPHTGTKTSVLFVQKYTEDQLDQIAKIHDQVAERARIMRRSRGPAETSKAATMCRRNPSRKRWRTSSGGLFPPEPEQLRRCRAGRRRRSGGMAPDAGEDRAALAEERS